MVFWVFGYGSLIWKPPPHAIAQKPGYIKGVVRRFAQSSIDHRGTPSRPGRVVTIIKSEEWRQVAEQDPFDEGEEDEIVWGVAYLIDPAREDEVREYLDIREKNGYSAHLEPVYHLVDKVEHVAIVEATVYIGRLDNPAFVGYEPIKELAEWIASCHGPSGLNKDYLYGLAESVRHLYPFVKDEYLFELERLVREADERGSA